MPQHGSGGWIVYDATHPQPAPPRPIATHTSVQVVRCYYLIKTCIFLSKLDHNYVSEIISHTEYDISTHQNYTVIREIFVVKKFSFCVK